MPVSRLFRAGAAAFFLGLLPGGAAAASVAAPGASFDYLYVEANAGGSSGGHAALRLEGQVYHFQNHAGLLVLEREPADDFLNRYAALGNRAIHGSRVAVEPAVLQRIERTFETRHRLQGRQLDWLEALREDRALLEALDRSRRRGERPPLPGIPAAGYFRARPGGAPDPALVRLRQRVAQSLGPSFLPERIAALGRRIRALRPLPLPPPGRWDPFREPPFRETLALRYRSLLGTHTALCFLRDARGLRADATRDAADPLLRLGSDERAALERHARGLEQRLLRTLAEQRADSGRVLLVGMARLAALERTRRAGRLVVLDSFGDQAGRILPSAVAARQQDARRLLAEAAGDLRQALRQMVGASRSSERLYADLEGAANRWHELARGLAGESLRVQGVRLVPSRLGPPALALWPRLDPRRLGDERRTARRREQQVAGELQRIYGYDLIRRNCVSELFEGLRQALGPGAGGLEEALGGVVDPHRSLAFIPFVSAAAVNAHLRVVARFRIAPERQGRLAEMRARENDLAVWLRELSPLTGHAYARNPADGWFLFFTDGVPWLRPLLGAANLVAGVGESAWGVLRLPVDGGQTLLLGAENALLSLPELLFVNIRKGTNALLAPERRIWFFEPEDPVERRAGAGAGGSPPARLRTGPLGSPPASRARARERT